MTNSNDKGGRSASNHDIADLLGEDAVRPWWRRPSTLATAALAIALGVAGYWWQGQRTEPGPSFLTQAASRGDLVVTVSANGTLQPTRAVNVGSELSGTVARVLVDVNDKVRKGQVLVELDTAKLGDQVRRSKASVASAQAKVAQTRATMKEAQANLGRMEEVARLSGGKVPSAAELDSARAALDRARADLQVAEASVADARAALSLDETNLGKASIVSPIDGVVLTRSVDPGNAVAASLQAVTLFNIAEDLTKMKLEVYVDEADVGMVEVGQPATFTVSAWPGRRYPARIVRVGYGATTQDNVVTYLADLEVDNTDLTLRPGMTATATITATERNDVLLVPNAALRFQPATTDDAAAAGEGGRSAQGSGGLVSQLMPRMVRGTSTRRAGAGSGAARQVWVLREGKPVAVAVSTGVTDGRFTEITGGELTAGDPVITEQTLGTRR